VTGLKLRCLGVLAVAACCAGCASPPSAHSRDIAEWAAQQGGIECLDSARQQRLERVARPLLAAYGRGVTLHVLASDHACAYAWPGGDVFVTRRLTEILDDNELAAAVAHELGHLMSDPRKPSAAAATLAPAADDDQERQADARGAALLKRAGLPAAAMTQMLESVANRGGLDLAERRALAERAKVRQSSTPASR
jgi:predicted Zn-dependent protease